MPILKLPRIITQESRKKDIALTIHLIIKM